MLRSTADIHQPLIGSGQSKSHDFFLPPTKCASKVRLSHLQWQIHVKFFLQSALYIKGCLEYFFRLADRKGQTNDLK